MLLPLLEQAVEGTEDEVARAAGGIDHLDHVVAELFDRRREREVEDELLDELRGLEQGVGLASRLGEVLVEVAEEAGVPLGVGEVMDQAAGFAAPTPEGDQVLRLVVRQRDLVERVVPLVEERLADLSAGDGVEALVQPVAQGLVGLVAEELRFGLLGEDQAVPRAGQVGVGQ